MITIDVSHHGPLFDGRAAHEVQAFLEDAKDEVAAQASANVHTYLNAQIKQPTPYYETQIIVQNLAGDRVVHDRGIIYGPWLEGTGTRNRTTRFKGYASFRKATQKTAAEAPALIDHVLQPHLERMR